MNSRALLLATMVGTMLQVAMVVAGHSNKSIAALFAVGGMGFSLVAGVIYASWHAAARRRRWRSADSSPARCARFIGIFVSYLLGDVPASLLALGTVSSAVTGAIGGAVGRLFGCAARRRRVRYRTKR